MSIPTDELLMRQVRDGGVAKLGLLFERYHRPLFSFFVRLVDRRGASEDLVQEVFLRMLKYRHTYRAESRFTIWMYKIAHNAKADYYHKRKRETPLPEDEAEPISQDLNASESMEQRQEIELLRAALDRLGEEKKEVLVLSRFQNLKYEEIAELLGCAVGTVKARVHRAIQDLREIYHELSSEGLT